ncbi:MAG: type I 3-dehydroquinate dehydratase [Candidatus Bathyarchaeia archaeon]
MQICVSLLPRTVGEAIELIEKAEKHKPNFIEIRLDCIRDYGKLNDIAESTTLPLIATNRAKDCGGKFFGNERERQKTLINAAECGFEYIDVENYVLELEDIVGDLRRKGVKVIISFHDFNKTPSKLKLHKIFRSQVESGADVCKIITTAKKVDDNLTLLNFLKSTSEISKIVCFAMGSAGKLSRVLSPLFGGFFTMASLEHGRETAAGQMTIEELRVIYQILGVN